MLVFSFLNPFHLNDPKNTKFFMPSFGTLSLSAHCSIAMATVNLVSKKPWNLIPDWLGLLATMLLLITFFF